MELIIVGVLCGIIAIIELLWMRISYQKNFKNVEGELHSLKKAKEYQSEVMMVFSKDHKVIFANKAAKNLFSLVKEKDQYILNANIELKIRGSEPIDFFEVLEKKNTMTKESFTFKDAQILTTLINSSQYFTSFLSNNSNVKISLEDSGNKEILFTNFSSINSLISILIDNFNFLFKTKFKLLISKRAVLKTHSLTTFKYFESSKISIHFPFGTIP